ncbi:AfsR/SARP family transcriptional regulator [Micromonospora sp. KC723]|uniref:AfsR/SARP family transcriptional regulator n=1 Tax=Micromonospora sp. KC723 TaxID=2530381 RepID=UPI0014055B6F|nr:AfsR/SARP family transcriptional regulator [Micromonospora sp. KC723]
MEFGVLGSFVMRSASVDLLPTAPKQRQLLALLVLNANRFVSIDTCVEELWQDDPPRTVVPTFQTYILQIRKCIAAGKEVGSLARAHKLLTTGRRGYQLVIAPESLDLTHYRHWVKLGREAMRRQDYAASSQAYRKALGTWRGSALSDVQVGPHLRAMVDSLEESRITATEQCFEAELRLGLHHELVSELCAATAQYPLNERFQAQYMLALYRAGRQVEALNLFHRLRKTLAEELGIGPSLPVRRLHDAMLSADGNLLPERWAS